jgi:TPR repeat protein
LTVDAGVSSRLLRILEDSGVVVKPEQIDHAIAIASKESPQEENPDTAEEGTKDAKLLKAAEALGLSSIGGSSALDVTLSAAHALINETDIPKEVTYALAAPLLALTVARASADVTTTSSTSTSTGQPQPQEPALAGPGQLRTAQYSLGMLLSEGVGVAPDMRRALELLGGLARLGHGMSMYQLGGFFLEGRGVKRDYGRALQLFKLAASAGTPHALLPLGQMYRDGLGM